MLCEKKGAIQDLQKQVSTQVSLRSKNRKW